MSKSPMKPKNSKTTGSLPVEQTQSREIGPQHGATGLSELPSAIPKKMERGEVATPYLATQCRQWLLDLSRPPLRALSETEQKEVNDLIEWLKNPSPRDWLSARIVTLLSHYFIAQTDERVAKAAAEDWIEILRVAPPWAVSNACRRYLAGDNRRRKPMPGDILNLARQELWFVDNAAGYLADRKPLADREPPKKPLTPEDMERRRAHVAKVMDGFSKMPSGRRQQTEAETQAIINQAKDDLAREVDRRAPKPSNELLNSPIVKNDQIEVDGE